jgi:hypothetical protein
MEVIMLSLFLRSRNHAPQDPASGSVPERDVGLHPGTEPTDAAIETTPDTGVEVSAGDISGLLSAITANAEFLEVLYGENRYLTNILNAAAKAKQQIHNAHECQE